MTNVQTDLALLSPEDADGIIHLFRPFVSEAMKANVLAQLDTRWVGQGPKVDAFENAFAEKVLGKPSATVAAVNSGTAALHLAAILSLEMQQRSPNEQVEVVSPIFTCTATNLAWVYEGAKIRWADVEPGTMNVSPTTVARAITPKTRAISVVHYGGLCVDIDGIRDLADARGIPVIEDAAQALGAAWNGAPVGTLGDFSAFSFQAIKHITTGDGGMLSGRDSDAIDKARRIRWFGIDRKAKQSGVWENDITELGYKYQMTDLAAAMGLAGLEDLKVILQTRRAIFRRYVELLAGHPRLFVVGADRFLEQPDNHAAWLVTIIVDSGLRELRAKLREAGIESNPVHYRNDRYSVFGGQADGAVPGMDEIDGRYLCLPIHMSMSADDVERVCSVIVGGW